MRSHQSRAVQCRAWHFLPYKCPVDRGAVPYNCMAIVLGDTLYSELFAGNHEHASYLSAMHLNQDL